MMIEFKKFKALKAHSTTMTFENQDKDQELNGIEVYLRIRPSSNPSGYISQDDIDENQIIFQLPRKQQLHRGSGNDKNDNEVIVNNTRTKYAFKFNGIMEEKNTQDDVFKLIGAPAVRNVLDGFNSTVFAYGQTGSGKTFTITGGPERYADRGVIPRAISMLFDTLQKKQNMTFSCYVSYFELYNENGYDLLARTDTDEEAIGSTSVSNRIFRSKNSVNDLPKVTMLEDEDGNYHFKNLSVNQVKSEEEALNLLFIGDTNRAIGETQMNQSSSRSHCIFTLMVEMRVISSDKVIRSKLNLVDLAGSERVHKTNSSGQTLKEAQYINTSLFFLEMVIVALHERTKKGKESTHVPYRNSMMTSVLRDSLGGNCKTIMVATISPEANQTDESISTCHFAQRVALVKNNAYINEEVDPELIIRRLKTEIKRLREEVIFLKGENGEGESLSDEQHRDLELVIRGYLFSNDEKIDEINIGTLTLTKIKASFYHFKKIFDEEISKSNHSNHDRSETEEPNLSNEQIIHDLNKTIRQQEDEIKVLVGMVKEGKQLGEFDSLSLLKNDNNYKREQNNKIQLASHSNNNNQLTRIRGVEKCMDSQILADPSLAFAWFRKRHPTEKNIHENKSLLQKCFMEAKETGAIVKDARATIQDHKNLIEKVRRDAALDAVITANQIEEKCHPNEVASRKIIEENVKVYKEAIDRLRELKSEIEHTKLFLEQSRISLQKDFDTWYEKMCDDEALNKSSFQNANDPIVETKVERHTIHHTAFNRKSMPSMQNVLDDGMCARSTKEKQSSSFTLPPGTQLTGIKETDDDIIAFYKAKDALIARNKARNK